MSVVARSRLERFMKTCYLNLRKLPVKTRTAMAKRCKTRKEETGNFRFSYEDLLTEVFCA